VFVEEISCRRKSKDGDEVKILDVRSSVSTLRKCISRTKSLAEVQLQVSAGRICHCLALRTSLDSSPCPGSQILEL
jgi:hypothetical protein